MTDENNVNKHSPGASHKQQKSNAKKSVLLLLFFVILVVAATFLIANSDRYFSGEETTSGDGAADVQISDNQSADGVSASGKGFPVSFDNGQIEKAIGVNSCVFVLTHDAVTCVSATGKIAFTHSLGYSEPAIRGSDSYAIAYDRQGSSFAVFNSGGLYFQGESDDGGKILTASVSNDGKALIASRRSGSTSALTVYDKNDGSIFAWACAKEHILSIDITKNGKNFACAAIGSTAGELYTKCYVFSLSEKDLTAEQTFASSSPSDCVIEGSKVHLVCTDKVIMFDYTEADIKPITAQFPATMIKRTCDRNGNVAVLTKKVDSFGDKQVSYFNSYNKQVFSVTVSDEVYDIGVDGSYVYILTAKQLLYVNLKGETVKAVDLNGASDGLVISSRRCYRYYLGTLSLI